VTRRRSFTPGPQALAGPRHRQSLPPGRKALVIAPWLAVALLIAVAAAVGPPGPSHPPAAHAPAAAAAQAAGIAAAPVTSPALARHHHQRHHRGHHHAAAAPAPAPPPARCHPTTASGNCYQPGEFCSHADAGMTGLAGNGEKIVCEKHHGWRWEPA
jgi:hypothetical protein